MYMVKKDLSIGLYPLKDCVLVELQQSRKNVSIKEGKYDSRTEGIVIRIPETKSTGTMTSTVSYPTTVPAITMKDLIGKRVFFEDFKEGSRIKRNDKIYSFIKIDDIRGYEDEQAS